MAKAAKKKPARKRSTKPAVDGEIVAKRAKAYHDMEPHLRDCQRWARLADKLANEDDSATHALVAEHAADEIDKLVAAYYALDFEP